MDIALAIKRNDEALLIYDQPLGFSPAWVESSADGLGLRIIGEDGQECEAGRLFPQVTSTLRTIHSILLVHAEGSEAVDAIEVPLVNQNYDGG